MGMNFKWRFNWGDCNSTYDVEVPEPCTVGEMVELILERSSKKCEWGDVSIGRSMWCDVFLFSYRYDRITETVPFWAERYKKGTLEEYRNKRVVSVTATGGYGEMSYVLQIEQAKGE